MKLFCRHNTVHVARWHASCVTTEMRGKELYVDRLGVHNFVRCSHCLKFLQTNQHERMFEQRKEPE